ncbi:NADPH-dependent FMN reductase [Pendulispora brunnea]|uniref:NADPH-dependent FMN reductase n=1 Tax=Pendulispora brunnea TaxID=2905690 RepID=A0ABZ2KJW8_9BACT
MTEPSSIVIVTGSPTRPSRTTGLAQLVGQRLSRDAFRVRVLHVRDLPAEALLHADFSHPDIQRASQWVAQADGVILVSPVYKAAYTGMLKAFIDILPQFALRDKVVLPLQVGGTLAHVLAIDYAMRPMLQSLDPRLIVSGLFMLDKTIEVGADGVTLFPDVDSRLEQVTQTFIEGLRAHAMRTRC